MVTFYQIMGEDFSKITSPTTVRITSPGEDFELKKQLMVLGGNPAAKDFIFEKGRIYPDAYWYQGWCLLLQKLDGFIQKQPLIQPMNAPKAIQLAFHKLKCQQLLQNAGLQTPKIWIEKVVSYDHLMETLTKNNIPQVFIKPYHGSSASGVMAFRRAKNKQVLYTTIHLKSGKLYNSLQLQRYTSIETIKTIIEKMIPAGLLVEGWIKKKRLRQKSVDFRILVINEKAAFVVPRMSNHFITNLHLGNEKGKIEAIEEIWGKSVIEQAKLLAIEAVKTVDGLFYAGVDVAISTTNQPYILEINAFGDMLLNIFKDNKTTYEYELEAWRTRF